jgi:hypothetical protein
MIKITSFYPFSYLLRVIQEFYEDKAVIKIKSLIAKREFEFEYKEATKITYKKIPSGDQQSFGLILNGIAAFSFIFFSNYIYANPILLLFTQSLFVIGVILFFTSYIKHRTILLTGENNKYLTSIRITRKNTNLIKEVIELVKNKSEILEETYSEKIFPEEEPVFELIEYDVLDYLSVSTVRFYKNELIGFQKNIIEENATNVSYIRLNGRVYRGKQRSDSWDSALFMTIMFSLIVANFYSVFDILPRKAFLFISAISGVFLVFLFLLGFARWEYIGLYDKNNKMVFWTWVNKSNKNKIEEIIEFIQSKIPAENKV